MVVRRQMFADSDTVKTEALAGQIGLAFAAAAVQVTEPMIADDAVHPADMTAALVEAHLLGAASAIASGARGGLTLTRDKETLAEWAGLRIRQYLAAIERTRE